jgi:hypothetical protein
MWKRYLALVALGCVAVAIATAALGKKEKEPTYQGHNLSYWVALYETGGSNEEAAANEAVTHIGTNTIPFLLKWIRYERPAWRERLDMAARRWRWPMPLQRLVSPLVSTRSERVAEGSGFAFKPLGTNGVTAIPELSVLAACTNKPQTAALAMQALHNIGTDGLPALLSVAKDTKHPLRYLAINNLALTPTNANAGSAVGPALIQFLNDASDSHMLALAAMWLGDNHYAPETSIPALTSCLTRPGQSVIARVGALSALAQYGPDAASALPAITNVLTDPALKDPIIPLRPLASNAIWKITTALATNSPPR